MAEAACVIDANVILRYLLADEPAQHAAAAAMLRGVDSGEAPVACDPVVLAEVVFVLRSVYRLGPEQVAAALLPLVRARGFLIDGQDVYVRALELLLGGMPHFGDACACARALTHCQGRIYSFDRALSSVEDITRLEAPPKSTLKG